MTDSEKKTTQFICQQDFVKWVIENLAVPEPLIGDNNDF